MKIYILTLFPNEMRQFFLKGLFLKAYKNKAFDIDFIDIRTFSKTKHNKVDDYPYGHRKGMILRADVLYDAVTSIKDYQDYHFVYLCPKGKTFDQKIVKEYSRKKGLIILAGYYEGVDERLFSFFNIERISIGDIVLSNGELPALIIADSVLRYVPGVLGNPDCIEEESLAGGLLESPQYTVPREAKTIKIPEVVISGNHKEIASWRKKMALKETFYKKPSLFIKYNLTQQDKKDIVESLVMDWTVEF